MKKMLFAVLMLAAGLAGAASEAAAPTPPASPDRAFVAQCYPAMFGYTRLMTALFPDDHVPAAPGDAPLAEREKAGHLEWLRTLRLTRSFAVLLGKDIDAQELGGKIERCEREYANRFGGHP